MNCKTLLYFIIIALTTTCTRKNKEEYFISYYKNQEVRLNEARKSLYENKMHLDLIVKIDSVKAQIVKKCSEDSNDYYYKVNCAEFVTIIDEDYGVHLKNLILDSNLAKQPYFSKSYLIEDGFFDNFMHKPAIHSLMVLTQLQLDVIKFSQLPCDSPPTGPRMPRGSNRP